MFYVYLWFVCVTFKHFCQCKLLIFVIWLLKYYLPMIHRLFSIQWLVGNLTKRDQNFAQSLDDLFIFGFAWFTDKCYDYSNRCWSLILVENLGPLLPCQNLQDLVCKSQTTPLILNTMHAIVVGIVTLGTNIVTCSFLYSRVRRGSGKCNENDKPWCQWNTTPFTNPKMIKPKRFDDQNTVLLAVTYRLH